MDMTHVAVTDAKVTYRLDGCGGDRLAGREAGRQVLWGRDRETGR